MQLWCVGAGNIEENVTACMSCIFYYMYDEICYLPKYLLTVNTLVWVIVLVVQVWRGFGLRLCLYVHSLGPRPKTNPSADHFQYWRGS